MGMPNKVFAHNHDRDACGPQVLLRTGIWSEKAIAEARRYGEVQIVASSKQGGYTSIPSRSDWKIDSDAAYLHYTANETIGGAFQKSIT